MALSGAAVGTAAIAGPALGAVVSSRLGFDWLFYSMAMVMLTAALLALLFLQEQEVKKEPNEQIESKSVSFTFSLKYAYLSIYLLLFTLGMLTFALPLKVSELGLQAVLTGPLLSTFGIVAIILFILPTNRLYDRYSKTHLMSSGLIIISLALLTLALAKESSHLFAAMSLYGIGFSFLFPSTSATVVESSLESKRGKSFGIYYACFSFGVISGSFLSGLVGWPPSELFLAGMFVVIIAFGLFQFVSKLR
ncbi:putative transporter [Halalkalibacter krulwichiae]|uniref:Putative transporter n=2 Tax=Halalkalibacter krulwichiae TaxID=199441 RepID=A0A1X9MGZ2_9BACI|nr:putative transporter [Halalkalibacter krulwichiae]